jgi:dienelactone hydrolase
LIDELSRYWVPAKIEIHPGADHGYGFTGARSFDQEAAERSWKGALDSGAPSRPMADAPPAPHRARRHRSAIAFARGA